MRITLLAAAFSLVALSGCEHEQRPDPEIRAERFDSCLKNVPSGPQQTKYNDWAEVVEACESAAYWQSFRAKETK